MTLSTTRSLYLAPVRVNLALRFIVVSIRAVSAGVHLALVPDHSRESLAPLAAADLRPDVPK